ncbi:hypothetical protein NCCNTM_47050 [Mycolicibacterium sp. NCC-Tsukiji]|nr:hypothetical protein NCCNTM_47050 [Mycolicibacterium sp. NCC-Tsukiji]
MPPEISWIRTIVGHGSVRPSRSAITAASLPMLKGANAMRSTAPALDSSSHEAAALLSWSVRTVPSSATRPVRRRAAKATTCRLELSSHCRSSIAINTNDSSASRSTTDRKAAATARGSVASPAPPTPRNSTWSMAIRWGSGKSASTPASTPLSRSASDAYASADSAAAVRAGNTRTPRVRA